MLDNWIPTFQCHGVNVPDEEGVENACGDCPFCQKEGHFFVNRQTGQWDCKTCGEKGNVVTFLTKISRLFQHGMSAKKWKVITDGRKLPKEAFEDARIGFNGECFTLPVFSERGTVRDIRRWAGPGNPLIATDKCKTQLYGMLELAKAPLGTVVWLCEGEWDCLAMRYVLRLSGRNDEIAVAVPSAHIFKQDWLPFFKGKRIVLCYDGDEPGDKGSLKAAKMLRGIAAGLQYVCWPESFKSGYDINDWVSDGLKEEWSGLRIVSQLEKITRDHHRRQRSPENQTDPAAVPETTISFAKVLETFRKWVKVDKEFEGGLAIALATCLANDVPGDPLWFYIVAPPGGGKTLILLALKSSDRTVFESSLTPASLVSGFKMTPDPSLIPLLNEKTAVFKDGTELLALHPDAKRQVYGTLRGAFDGHVKRPFGNGVVREYHVHFNMLIGVTPVVHADNQAMMGERFLKYEMHEDPNEVRSKIRVAINNVSHELKMDQELSEVCRKFLLRKVDPTKLPEIKPADMDRLISMAQLLSMLRAQVDRELYGDREIKYKPTYETGTRIAKQISKLAQLLTFVYEVPSINERIMQLIERVIMDTSIGFHLHIVTSVLNCENKGLSMMEISKAINLPISTCMRKVQDLEQLHILEKRITARKKDDFRRGPIPPLWRVKKEVLEIWYRVKGGKVIEEV